MNEEQYRQKGREMTLDYLTENQLVIHIYGTFNGSDISINEYHNPADADSEVFHFGSWSNLELDYIPQKEAVASEI